MTLPKALAGVVPVLFLVTLTIVLMWVSRIATRGIEKSRNERAAVTSLQTIHRAQVAYAGECGGGHYATSLMDLATRPPGKSAGYLSPAEGELGRTMTSAVSGYFFTIGPGLAAAPGSNDCNDFPTRTRYYAVAVPIQPGITGDRSFATNQEGSVWERYGLPPPVEPFGPPSKRSR